MAVLDSLTIGDINILIVDADPTITGVSAPLGSLILLNDGSGLFLKNNTGTTNWVKTLDTTNTTNITTLGTITTGIWNATAITDTYISSATNWNTAYNNRITSLTTTGTSGAATLSSNILNIPTYTLAGLGGQPLDGDLTAVAALAGAGFAVRTTTNTWATRSIVAGTGINVTNSDGVFGSPTVSIDTAYVGQTSITTVGTITSGVWNGTVIANNFIATTLTGKTYDGLTNTSNVTGFSIAGGTTSKTLTINNTLTLAGTDSSTLNIGAGGTLGTAAFTNSTAYEVPLTITSGLTRTTNTIRLGGTLSQATTLTTTSNTLTITGTNAGVAVSSTRYSNSQFYSFIIDSVSGNTLRFEVDTTSIEMSADNVGGFFLFQNAQTITNNGTNNNHIIQDILNNKGLVYSADYSANFTPESLVSKRYVDAGLTTKQATLTSGTTIKTINGASILGSGNLTVTSFDTQTFGITIDGAGSPIITGFKQYVIIPYNCIINEWYIIGDTIGSCVIDVWKNTSIPTVANTITGTEKPTLSSQQTNSDTNLSTWTTTVNSGDIIGFNVDSASVITKLTLIIKVTKT